MLPADQGLDADRLDRVGHEPGLEMDDQLVLGQGAAQIDLERPARLRPLVHLGREEPAGATPVGLGPIEGEIRIPQQLLAAVPVARPQGGADAEAHMRSVTVQHDGCRHRLKEPPAERLDNVGTARIGAEDHELVAADPGNDVGPAHDTADAGHDLLQQQVAGCMAERVVDSLEAVEIERQQGRA